jgi:hypothetical protein
MKKLILITACMGFFAATSFAQVDTTKSSTKPTTQTPTQSDQLKNRSASEQDMKGWTKINSSDLPASVRQTLSNSQYSGWESGTVYRNDAGDTYSVKTMGKNNGGARTYYFDKNGKITKKPNE